VLYKASDNSTIETIDVTTTSVSISGAQATITLDTSLSYSTEYYVKIAATAFDDAVGYDYAGITDTTSWSFTTDSAPPPPSTGGGTQPTTENNGEPVANIVDLDSMGILPELQATVNVSGANNAINLQKHEDSSYLQATVDDKHYLLRPIKVEDAPAGASPGIRITEDGLVELVTQQARMVTVLAEPQQLEELTSALQKMGFKIEQQVFGMLKVNPNNSNRTNIQIWYASRASYDAFVAEDGAVPGIFAVPSSDPVNTVRYDYYYEKDEILYRQRLYPTSADWQSLKTYLSTLGTASIDTQGYITLQTAEDTYRAVMDYRVESTQETSQFQIEKIDDINGDGINDYMVTYENGDQQILYLISVN